MGSDHQGLHAGLPSQVFHLHLQVGYQAGQVIHDVGRVEHHRALPGDEVLAAVAPRSLARRPVLAQVGVVVHRLREPIAPQDDVAVCVERSRTVGHGELLEHLLSEDLVGEGAQDDAVEALGGVVEVLGGGHDVSPGLGRVQAGGLEEVLAVPDALHPGINGYSGVLGRAGGRLGEL